MPLYDMCLLPTPTISKTTLLIECCVLKIWSSALFPLFFFLTPYYSIIDRALKMIGFIKRNTKHFTFISYLHSLYFFLVRSILECGIVVEHQYLKKDNLRIDCIQNRFLSYAALILKTDHPPHDYITITSLQNTLSLISRHLESDVNFISSLFNGTFDAQIYYPLSCIVFQFVKPLFIPRPLSPYELLQQLPYP